MAMRPVPVPFDAGLTGERARLRELAAKAKADVSRAPVRRPVTLTRALREAGADGPAIALRLAARRGRPPEGRWGPRDGAVAAGRQVAAEGEGGAGERRDGWGESWAGALVQSPRRADEGLELYERLIVERPDNPWLHFRRGAALAGQGRYKEAEGALLEALRRK